MWSLMSECEGYQFELCQVFCVLLNILLTILSATFRELFFLSSPRLALWDLAYYPLSSCGFKRWAFSVTYFCSATAVPTAVHWCSSTVSCCSFSFHSTVLARVLCTALFCSFPIRSLTGVSQRPQTSSALLAVAPVACWPGPGLAARPSSRASWPLWVFLRPAASPFSLLNADDACAQVMGGFLLCLWCLLFPIFDSLCSYLPVSCLFLLVCLFFPKVEIH